ncbi:uncharacterized protein BXZ73DRAFT_107205 [Epithele typhae]|uniref:uncharacterized protein n=1 Tax=Epithele typhae TaxID=378194 RepID=UPI002007A552|nr:uncharacterized protein BXZ73DRAFT_107205 [Epithele typhae]KAH9912757.1 hypothetical protein BXZ73DRAFT_107205 [Epithele typhae]
MSRGIYKPYDLVPDWLVESPITFDDLRHTSPPATLFRVSLPPSPVLERRASQVRRDSVASTDSDALSLGPQDEKPLTVDIEIDAVSELDLDAEDAEEIRVQAVEIVQRLEEVQEEQDQDADGEQERAARRKDKQRRTRELELDLDTRSFLEYGDDDDDEGDADLSASDEATLSEQQGIDPSPIDPFFKPKFASLAISPARTPTPTSSPASTPQPHSASPVHSRASSFDCTSPWFMHFPAAALAALDDQLLQTPIDAFADLCYAQSVVELADAAVEVGVVAATGAYSWRRFSRLRPMTPFSEEDGSHSGMNTSVYQNPPQEPQERLRPQAPGSRQPLAALLHLSMPDSEIVRLAAVAARAAEDLEAEVQADADDAPEDDRDSISSFSSSDSEGLVSPEQPPRRPSWSRAARGGDVRVYSPPLAEPHHLRHWARGSDGSIQFRSHAAMPAHFSHTPSHKPKSQSLPFHPAQRAPLPGSLAHQESLSRLRSPSPVRTNSPEERRTPTGSPIPFVRPATAVTQAQLAMLFGSGSGTRTGESVHFFPTAPPPTNGSKPKRAGTLRISTNTGSRQEGSPTAVASAGAWISRAFSRREHR